MISRNTSTTKGGFVSVLLLGAATALACAETERVAYSFVDGNEGGVAVVEIDSETGRIIGQKKLFSAPEARKADKLRTFDRDRGLALVSPTKKGPHVFLVDMDGLATYRSLELPARPDELRISGNVAIATCEKDKIALIDLSSGRVREWDANDLLNPPGNEAEDVLVSVKRQLAVMSFQKDGDQGNKLGSRIVVFRLPDMSVAADLLLPRDHEDLHIESDNTAQGPNPEVLFVSEPVDRLIATLDLYGAVAVMDWEAATQGRLQNLWYLTTSLDDSWGTAFPDRAMLVYMGGNPYALVCNAGKVGGSVMVSLRRRQVVWRAATPPGLEKPVFVGHVGCAFSVCSGKTKVRIDGKISKTNNPQSGVYVFDLSSSEAVKRQEVLVVPSETPLLRIAPTASKRWLILAGGDEAANTLYVFDPFRKQFVDSQSSIGDLKQFASS